MIRKATPEDFPVMLEMAQKFIEKAWIGIVDFDAESCLDVLNGLHANGILLITEDRKGMIGVQLTPWHFNKHVMSSIEVFWWCEGEGGPLLRKEGERLAREAGATSFHMSRIEGMRDAALDRLYRSNGFRPTEHMYYKELN